MSSLADFIIIFGLVFTLVVLFLKYLCLYREMVDLELNCNNAQLMLEVCRNRNSDLSRELRKYERLVSALGSDPPQKDEIIPEDDLPF